MALFDYDREALKPSIISAHGLRREVQRTGSSGGQQQRDERRNKNAQILQNEDGITLDYVLAVLDGIVELNESIVFFTTNTLDIKYRIDNYNFETNLISIYGFSSITEAQSRLQEIIMKSKMLSNNKYFVISAPQYINMLVFKTLDKLKS